MRIKKLQVLSSDFINSSNWRKKFFLKIGAFKLDLTIKKYTVKKNA